MDIIQQLNYWSSVYQEELRVEQHHEEALSDFFCEDLREALDEQPTG